jgi:cation:H+ antiporter
MYDALLSIFPTVAHPPIVVMIFVFSLFLLIKSADVFIDSAEGIGLKINLPYFIIGITIIGMGTSLPELATSIASILQSTPENDLTEIVSANVIGSNIANILLGIGLACLIQVVKVDRNMADNDIPFLFGSTAIAIYFLYDGVLSQWEGILLIWMFFVFLAFSLLNDRQPSFIDKEAQKNAKKQSFTLFFSLLIISGIGIIFASDFTIQSLSDIAPIIGIPNDVASMVLLAVGTSFPEIFVSIVAIQKGKAMLAIGNILGSNISNILGILGISAIITDISVSEKSITVGLPFMAIATLFFIFSAMDNRFRLWEGLMTIAIFLAFLGSLFELF